MQNGIDRNEGEVTESNLNLLLRVQILFLLSLIKALPLLICHLSFVIRVLLRIDFCSGAAILALGEELVKPSARAAYNQAAFSGGGVGGARRRVEVLEAYSDEVASVGAAASIAAKTTEGPTSTDQHFFHLSLPVVWDGKEMVTQKMLKFRACRQLAERMRMGEVHDVNFVRDVAFCVREQMQFSGHRPVWRPNDSITNGEFRREEGKYGDRAFIACGYLSVEKSDADVPNGYQAIVDTSTCREFH